LGIGKKKAPFGWGQRGLEVLRGTNTYVDRGRGEGHGGCRTTPGTNEGKMIVNMVAVNLAAARGGKKFRIVGGVWTGSRTVWQITRVTVGHRGKQKELPGEHLEGSISGGRG